MPDMDDKVSAFEEALTDTLLEMKDNSRYKKAKEAFLDDIWQEVECSVIDRMGEQIGWFVRDMAERTVKAMLNGQDREIRRYLGLNGYTGRSDSPYSNRDPAHPVIHGTLFETGAIELRKRIAQAHADLIQNERIKDLEDQVASLVDQVNKAETALERERAWRAYGAL